LLLLLGILTLPAFAQKKPKADPSKDLEKGATSEKMLKAGQLSGKIMAIVESKKALRIQVTVPVQKLNEGAVNGLAQAQQSYQQAALHRDANGMMNAQRDMIRHQANLYTVENRSQDMEVGTIDDVKVRAAQPPEQFDDKGKVKRLTSKELKELKGSDPKLPGYNAEFSDLHEGQYVLLTLVQKKGSTSRLPVRHKGKGKDLDADLLADNQPQASMIVILGETKQP